MFIDFYVNSLICVVYDVGSSQLLQKDPFTNTAQMIFFLLLIKAFSSWWRYQMEAFSALLAFCVEIHRWPVKSPHKSQWRGALVFSMISAWTNSWASNGYAGDLRRHRAHYNVIVIWMKINQWISLKLLLWAPINNGPTFVEVSQPVLESMMTQFIDAYMCHKEHEFHFTICLSFSILDNFPIIYAKTLCPTSWNAFWKKNHCVLLKHFTWVPMNNESVFVDAMA